MTAEPEQEVRSVVEAWFQAFSRRDLRAAMALIAPDEAVFFFGTGGDERRTGEREIHAALAQRFAEAGTTQVSIARLSVSVVGQTAWALSDCLREIDLDGRRCQMPARQTLILEKRQGRWLIVHSHFSSPAMAEALRESELRYRELAESLPHTVFEIDLEGNLLFWNDNAFAMWGYSREGFTGMNVLEAIIPAQRAIVRENIRRLLAGEFFEFEYTAQRTDGSTFPAVIHSRPVFRNHQPVALRGFVIDMTERKRAEEERLHMQSRFQSAQRLESLGILAGGIAHDFNNLLMVIMSRSELAGMQLPPDSPAQRHLEKIENAAQQAADLTNQMLAYAGKGQYSLQTFDLSRLVEEMAHLLKTVAAHNIALHLVIASELPAIEGDANQLREVIMSLFTNAMEAIGERNGHITVCTRLVAANTVRPTEAFADTQFPTARYVALEITDNGCGMDPETQTKIFDPFFTTKFIGRGLGLSAVLGIVRAHRGTIQVSSEPGRGTTFQVLLPGVESIRQAEQAPMPGAAKPHGGGTVLVVDDEEGVRDTARATLEEFGFQVLTAGDGREGVTLFQKHADAIQAVLLDMTMPHMDGEETFRALHRIRPGVRVLLSSGYREQDIKTRFAEEGLAGFIQKPYRPLALVEKVRAVIEGSSQSGRD